MIVSVIWKLHFDVIHGLDFHKIVCWSIKTWLFVIYSRLLVVSSFSGHMIAGLMTSWIPKDQATTSWRWLRSVSTFWTFWCPNLCMSYNRGKKCDVLGIEPETLLVNEVKDFDAFHLLLHFPEFSDKLNRWCLQNNWPRCQFSMVECLGRLSCVLMFDILHCTSVIAHGESNLLALVPIFAFWSTLCNLLQPQPRWTARALHSFHETPFCIAGFGDSVVVWLCLPGYFNMNKTSWDYKIQDFGSALWAVVPLLQWVAKSQFAVEQHCLANYCHSISLKSS